MVGGLMTPDGRPLCIFEVLSRHGLKVGTMLEPTESQSTSLTRHEPYWVKQPADLRPVALQRSASGAAPGEVGRDECID